MARPAGLTQAIHGLRPSGRARAQCKSSPDDLSNQTFYNAGSNPGFKSFVQMLRNEKFESEMARPAGLTQAIHGLRPSGCACAQCKSSPDDLSN